ncbi:carbon storage regulator CsrA [Cohnella lubricantis]|uniref:Translational regulator CsrA n=1 Tax=Cohnella lubricantis TaxID=2163172 RepID=A0A841TBK4_9BACL|nr:carbon storage regulator CsrA [Cohnella lubricantis]MBB6677409.1 carbon storage regulator CsrA [Cohnella lubricantis]MBP2118700.1 carbon storage regulator [Cohnella lubricantis]
MLILTRKIGQSIMLGNDVEIVVSAIDGDQVKIGIQAPKELKILRKEVYEEVRESNREAAAPKASLQQLKDLPE